MASEDAKRAKRPCFIDTLPDPILAKIFEYLPHAERLRVSEVCSRWHAVTRLDWLDIVDLNLTPIPSANIGAILRLSPNVESIFALRRFLIMNDLCEHYQTNLTSIKLYDVKMGFAAIVGDEKHTSEQYQQMMLARAKYEHRFVFRDVSASAAQSLDLCTSRLNQYFEKLPQIEELVLHNMSLTDLQRVAVTSVIPFSLQSHRPLNTIARLQLSGSGRRDLYSARLLSESLRTLQQLECLMVHLRVIVESGDNNAHRAFCDAVASLQNLRELSLDVRFDFVTEQGYLKPRFWGPGSAPTPEIALRLPKLEVLFLIHQDCARDAFITLCTNHPTLRVLMFTGMVRTLVKFSMPERKVQLSESSQPLPYLHLFLYKGLHDRFLRFTPSAAAKITLIDYDVPIDQFLKSGEVEEILDGVWVAEMIQETASYDSHMWD